MTPHEIEEVNAPKIAKWLRERGGLLIWKSHDLADPGASVTTPAKTAEGADTPPPHWKFPKPDRHITSADELVVFTAKVVETFKVKLVRRGQMGQKLVLSDASTRKVRTKLSKHEDSFHRFKSTGTSAGDTMHALTYGEDEVEICVNDTLIPFTEWEAKQQAHETNQSGQS
jgi:hypothetical protein